MDTVCAVGMHYWHVFSYQTVDLKIRSWRWRRWARTSLRQPRCFGRWSIVVGFTYLFVHFWITKKKKKSELLNIRDTLPDCFCPKILSSAEYILLSDLKPKQWDCAMETQGRWAGTLVRFRRRGLRAPLPGIFLPNVLSLANKTDQLQLLTKKWLLFTLWICLSHSGRSLHCAGPLYTYSATATGWSDADHRVGKEAPGFYFEYHGDFNHTSVWLTTQERPRYKEFVKCSTRQETILDPAYSTIKWEVLER